MYKANFGNVVLRYYLMMAVVILGGFMGWPALQLLALPIFLSALFAIHFPNPFNISRAAKSERPEMRAISGTQQMPARQAA